MPSAPAVRCTELGLPLAGSEYLAALLVRWAVRAVASPQPFQPAVPTEAWQQLPAQCRACQRGEEAAADVNLGPQHQPWSRLGPAGLLGWVEPFALISGLVQGNTGVVFTVGDGPAFSVPVQALIQLQSYLLKPFSGCPGLPALAVG